MAWISIAQAEGSPRRNTTPGDACRGFEGKASKAFFSEEKKQKTLCLAPAARSRPIP